MPCDKHGQASSSGTLCAVCLLEQALAPAIRDLTILVPLGRGAQSSVFLVRQAAPSEALLRLKLWYRLAPVAFLDDIAELTRRLEDVTDAGLVPPLAACVDAVGRPAVLSAFRQGVPVLDSVQSGVLDRAAALALLEPVRSALDRCHAAGLVHGSIAPGNVLVEPGRTAAFLVDFGVAAPVGGGGPRDAASDRAGLAALVHSLTSGPARGRSQP
jgi:eukaryotic-like serine/threonine-protein kinase